jgi:hypothetical protein
MVAGDRGAAQRAMTDRYGEVLLGFATDTSHGSTGSVMLLEVMTSHTMGGVFHILLVIAIVVVPVRVIQGWRIL